MIRLAVTVFILPLHFLFFFFWSFSMPNCVSKIFCKKVQENENSSKNVYQCIRKTENKVSVVQYLQSN